MGTRLKVLIVDDSVFFRNRIETILTSSPELEVVGAVADGQAAIEQTRRLAPDVITMDVEMPVMDGITAVRRIMGLRPTPILMLSSLTYAGAKATLEALEAGAIDFLPKQFDTIANDGGEASESLLVRRVITVGRSRLGGRVVHARRPPPRPSSFPLFGAGAAAPSAPAPLARGRLRLVAIGASTGGPVALQKVLASLPGNFPIPLAAVVHMPASFTPAFAERLNGICAIEVKEAADGDLLRAGRVLLAPGGRQMMIDNDGPSPVVRIGDAHPGQAYRPSVDVLFGSAARALPGRVLAIVLTGMGADGREGARLLKSGGSAVWSQDEESSVVYGMPQAVAKAGLSDRVVALDEIGAALRRQM